MAAPKTPPYRRQRAPRTGVELLVAALPHELYPFGFELLVDGHEMIGGVGRLELPRDGRQAGQSEVDGREAAIFRTSRRLRSNPYRCGVAQDFTA